MAGKALGMISGALTALATLTGAAPVAPGPLMVRIAELEIDPARIDAYKALLAEEVEASVRLEPGVLSLSAVEINDAPGQIRLLEVYASQSAYEAHLKSPQFIKYKTLTAPMVRSLRLIPTTPIKLCAKSGKAAGAGAFCR